MVKNIEFKKGPSIALSPPHSDTVTSLTKFKGVLVSGSKDRSLRFWDPISMSLMHDEVDAHQDAITCMASDEDYIYTGCRDNIIKSWQFKELSKDQYAELQDNKENSEGSSQASGDRDEGRYKADVSSYLLGHNSNVTSICAMNDENNSIFTGGNDKSLKLWRR